MARCDRFGVARTTLRRRSAPVSELEPGSNERRRPPADAPHAGGAGRDVYDEAVADSRDGNDRHLRQRRSTAKRLTALTPVLPHYAESFRSATEIAERK